eukprot:GHVQ01028769.1.p1 GENE.GHVQ01028769.1~~GHVQ01028769.1.p1  ORF type:complete len:671 (+),score=84.46 GHVQ01028769.1:176-2188(+)
MAQAGPAGAICSAFSEGVRVLGASVVPSISSPSTSEAHFADNCRHFHHNGVLADTSSSSTVVSFSTRSCFSMERAFRLLPGMGHSMPCYADELPSRLSSSTHVAALPQRTQLNSLWRNNLELKWTNLQLCLGLDPVHRYVAASGTSTDTSPPKRRKLVLLGTGWGTVGLISSIDVRKYDVTIISPRNYFTFTPFLPSVCSGTLSARAALEPIRNFAKRGGKKVMEFYEASAADIDVDHKKIVCQTKSNEKFTVDYDLLVVGVGAETNTFGIPGAKTYSHFLKEVENAREIHRQVLDSFERASLPGTSEETKRRLLHFVVVGGGPTGVETAAELHDLIHEDILRHFPDLRDYTKVTLIEMLPKVLPMFSESASSFTQSNFNKMGVECRLKTKVTGVTENDVTVEYVAGDSATAITENIPYGFIVWASGVGQVPFVKKLLSKIDEQKQNRLLVVDPQLRVKGCDNVYALGDCSRIEPQFFHTNDSVVRQLYNQSQSHPHKASTEFLESLVPQLSLIYPQIAPSKCDFQKLPRKSNLTLEEFRELLKSIDTAYVSPSPTAQFASQEGSYLGVALNQFCKKEDEQHAPAFVEHWNGYLAYIGNGNAVVDLPGYSSILGGVTSMLIWKAAYIQLVKTCRTTIIVACDWLRVKLGGRDVGKDHTRDGSADESKKTA